MKINVNSLGDVCEKTANTLVKKGGKGMRWEKDGGHMLLFRSFSCGVPPLLRKGMVAKKRGKEVVGGEEGELVRPGS